MLESLLKINNFYWSEDVYQPPLDLNSMGDWTRTLQKLQGQFSFAFCVSENKVILARDRLGINKLFFAIHGSGGVMAANYLIDLVRKGVPFETIYSVPSGHFLEIDLERRTLSLTRYFELKIESKAPGMSLEKIAQNIRNRLDLWFSRLAEQFGSRRVCLCLSGGLDSGLIAAFAKEYFDDVTAYSYSYTRADEAFSEDAHYARKLAEFLEIPFQLVPASSEDLLASLEGALCYGQDWRDFNVHCAIVNEILGKAIASGSEASGGGKPPLVLTGDLMNEFFADYTPVSYGGREYYKLPKLDLENLRFVLIRGLDAGDREIGIFNHHGLDAIQPYGLLLDQYLQLPDSFISVERAKQNLVREIAGDLLPSFIFSRSKVRAQIGNSSQPTGILPVLVESGRDSRWIRKTFCDLFKIDKETALNRFILAGLYRFATEFPKGGSTRHGYFTRKSC
jgi:asparagine synthetase B (glutamine-hydrolysing)